MRGIKSQLGFDTTLANGKIDRSSAAKLAQSIEAALLGEGFEVGADPTPELYADKTPVSMSPAQFAKTADMRIYGSRIRVVKTKKLVPKPQEVYDFEDETIDFEDVTSKFITHHDKAVKDLSEILTETIAWQQALKFVVARFRSQEAFADVAVAPSIMEQMLTLRVVEKLSAVLGVNKQDALALLAKKDTPK